MSKTKVIKTIVNVEDYRKLSVHAAVRGKKIYEVLGEAITGYLNTHGLNSKSIEYPFNPTEVRDAAIPTTATGDSLKEKVKIYLDTYDVHPKDHSMATYKKLKEKFTKLDIETFDKIQHERAGD